MLTTIQRHCCSLLLFWLLLTGCHTPTPPKEPQPTLSALLLHLSKEIPPQEAYTLATDIQTYAKTIEKRFDRHTSSPWLHNFLVNVGIKEKGLCYHYSDALYTHLATQKRYPHFAFHLVGAHIGSYWQEHNALLVTAKDGALQKGIIIDAWRKPGKLYFVKVTQDPKYHWVHRPERGCCVKDLH